MCDCNIKLNTILIFRKISDKWINDELAGFLMQLTAFSTFQLFYPCLIANDIEDMSERFMDFIMENDWTNVDLKTKKLLLIFMQHLNHPVVKFNLFSVVDINLNTFLRASQVR
jgi:hypothetical protein